jgi:hypothetical protein
MGCPTSSSSCPRTLSPKHAPSYRYGIIIIIVCYRLTWCYIQTQRTSSVSLCVTTAGVSSSVHSAGLQVLGGGVVPGSDATGDAAPGPAHFLGYGTVLLFPLGISVESWVPVCLILCDFGWCLIFSAFGRTPSSRWRCCAWCGRGW